MIVLGGEIRLLILVEWVKIWEVGNGGFVGLRFLAIRVWFLGMGAMYHLDLRHVKSK